MMKFPAVALITFFSFSPLHAADIKTGIKAYEAGDYTTALAEFSALAKAGNPEAQSRLAWMYDNGRGVKQSYETAYMWILLSIENGNTKAEPAQKAIAEALSNRRISKATKRAKTCLASGYKDCGL